MPEMVIMVRSAGEPGSLPPMIKAMSENKDPELFPEIRQIFSRLKLGLRRVLGPGCLNI